MAFAYPSFGAYGNHFSAEDTRRVQRKASPDRDGNSVGMAKDQNSGAGGQISSQPDKLRAQRQQYKEARERLEEQLLKLKEQRESFKESGAKHEDEIMKENARMQKEVKSRIQQVNEVIDKVEMALRAAEERERSRSVSKRSSSPEETKSSKKKKKKKEKEKSSSESESEQERSSKKRKRKKKKAKKSSSSSDSSSESEAETQKKKKGGSRSKGTPSSVNESKGSNKSDETVMELLAKMSEAYMKAKQEVTELTKKVKDLEAENLVLRKQNNELKGVKDREQSNDGGSILRNAELLISQTQEMIEQKQQPVKSAEMTQADVRRDVSPKHDDDRGRNRGGADHRYEDDRNTKTYDNRGYYNDRRNPRQPYGGGGRGGHRYEGHRRYGGFKRSRSRSRSRDRDTDRNRRSRSRSEERRPQPPRRDRNDRVNLDDWVQKPMAPEPVVDSKIADSLKLKMMEKVEKERQKEEYRKRWTKQPENESLEKSVAPKKPELPPLPTGPRPQVAIQWGQRESVERQRPAEEVQNTTNKKAAPLIGKRPGMGRSKKTPDPDKEKAESSKFGPPATQANLPPPTTYQPPGSNQCGLTPEMYMQAITATMPSDAPPPELPFPQLMRAPPKNPTPQNVDINSILAAAQQHIKKKKQEWETHSGSKDDLKDNGNGGGDGEIPLPPLPAATDKDPKAEMDTRPPKEPTPPPPKEKTELDLMLEKHQTTTYAEANEYGEAAKKQQADSAGDVDREELEMLGIDPDDFAGFGKN